MNMEHNNWNDEYIKQGIPSSFRDDPSGVLVWCLKNLEFLGINGKNLETLDVGCGKGRNPIYLAKNGFKVTAFDSSSVAIGIANNIADNSGLKNKPEFIVQRLQDGLPLKKDEQFDLITDIFVYKHQIDFYERKKYRENLKRALKKSGVLLLSLADREDGYYSQCPEIENNNSGLKTIIDPEVKIESVLFDLNELILEMEDEFSIQMAWVKVKEGKMHDHFYLRKTIATLWKPKK